MIPQKITVQRRTWVQRVPRHETQGYLLLLTSFDESMFDAAKSVVFWPEKGG